MPEQNNAGKRRWTWRDWAPIFGAVGISTLLTAVFGWPVWGNLLAALVLVVVLSAVTYRGVDDPDDAGRGRSPGRPGG